MTNAEQNARLIVGRWYDNEADAKTWCNKQKKSAIVIKAKHPNGQTWYMAMMKSIADRAEINMEFAVYRKLVHETKKI